MSAGQEFTGIQRLSTFIQFVTALWEVRRDCDEVVHVHASHHLNFYDYEVVHVYALGCLVHVHA